MERIILCGNRLNGIVMESVGAGHYYSNRLKIVYIRVALGFRPVHETTIGRRNMISYMIIVTVVNNT